MPESRATVLEGPGRLLATEETVRLGQGRLVKTGAIMLGTGRLLTTAETGLEGPDRLLTTGETVLESHGGC